MPLMLINEGNKISHICKTASTCIAMFKSNNFMFYHFNVHITINITFETFYPLWMLYSQTKKRNQQHTSFLTFTFVQMSHGIINIMLLQEQNLSLTNVQRMVKYLALNMFILLILLMNIMPTHIFS